MAKVDEARLAEEEKRAQVALDKERAALGNFLDAHVEFDSDEERREVGADLNRLTEIYKRLGRIEGYKQVLSFAGITPKLTETARHLALQEITLLEDEGVRFVDPDKSGDEE